MLTDTLTLYVSSSCLAYLRHTHLHNVMYYVMVQEEAVIIHTSWHYPVIRLERM
jgi:hypothetical protein